MEGTTAYVLATSESAGGGSGDSIQVTTLDDTAPVGTIVQYIGATTPTATNGLFYKKEATGWVKATIENEVAGSFDVKNGNVYVTYKDPEGDRAGIMMGIQGGNAIVSTSGNTNSLLLDSLTVETQDDLKVNGYLYADQVYAPDGKDTIEINNDTLVDGKLTVNSGVVIYNDDETVVETGEQGHVYFKKGVTIGTDAEDKRRSLTVNGTLRMSHDIYGEGIHLKESMVADGSITSNKGVNSCGTTNLGDKSDIYGGDIHFFPSYTVTKLDNGSTRVQSNGDELAFMTIQHPTPTTSYASLQMNNGRVVAHELKTDVLDSATSSGRIDVKTELHLDSIMETRKVEVRGGYPIIIYDPYGKQSIKLSSNGGAIFCGDIHCNGYLDYRHDVDGINKVTADRYFRYYGSEAIEIGKYYYIGSFGAKGSKVTLPNNWRKYSKLAIVIAWGGDVYNNWKMEAIGEVKEVATRFVAENGTMEIRTEFGDFALRDYSKDVLFSSGDLAVYNAYLFGVG